MSASFFAAAFAVAVSVWSRGPVMAGRKFFSPSCRGSTRRAWPVAAALARPTSPSTRSMIEWAVLRAYRDWLETKAADTTLDKLLDRELVS